MFVAILIISTLSLLLSCHILCKKYRAGTTNISEYSGTSQKVPYLKAQDTLTTLDNCTVETRSISRKARNMEELVTLLAMRTKQNENEDQEDA